MAVDAGHVYWTNYSGRIERANLDGTGIDPTFITGATAQAVTVDAGHIYWPDRLTGNIGRANLDGTDPDRSFITGARFPVGVAVDAGHVYWTNDIDYDHISGEIYGPGTIGRANLDGTHVDQSFIATPLYDSPSGLAVDAGHVYWDTYYATTIGRANLDGTDPDDNFLTGLFPFALAVDVNQR